MKILIVGCGVIGTIFGELLSKSQNDVFHYLRTEEKVSQYQRGIRLELMDGRKSIKDNQLEDVYVPKMITSLDNVLFELVLVCVNSHQVEDFLVDIQGKCHGSLFVIFNNFWGEADIFEKYLSNEKYLFAFPNAGGGFSYQNNMPLVRGAISEPVTIGSINSNNKQYIRIINELFLKAGFKTRIEKNMLHWLWSHYAVICGLNVACVSAGGNDKFLGSFHNMKIGVQLVKENLEVCKARGVNPKEFSDPTSFMLPTPIISFGLWINMKMNKCATKIALEYKGSSEIVAMYKTMLRLGKKYNVNMKYMLESKEKWKYFSKRKVAVLLIKKHGSLCGKQGCKKFN